MRTRIQQWGSSLALRIPKSFALEAHLHQGTLVDVTIDNEGKLIVVVVPEFVINLETLLQGVTAQNRHAEIDMGSMQGNEMR
jgi:antitoxin MazE